MKKDYNVFDYLHWRGDLSFEDAPFNEVDNLILSMMSFPDFLGIVPSLPSPASVSFEYAMDQFLSRQDKSKHLGAIIPDTIIELSELASKTRRFGSLQLTAYENTVDEEKDMQFAALTVILPYGKMFASFRGTDDTLVGWREDFDLAFTPQVNAQHRAAEYLNSVCSIHSGEYYTGGHSKGGNLAVWSVLNVPPEVQDRLICAYNNDGPGFGTDMTKTAEYKRLNGRIKTIIPESSIVGMLLEHDEKYEVIHSTENFIMQHDPLSWVVDCDKFVYMPERSSTGKRSDAAIKKWIASLSKDEMKLFTENLFKVLDATDAKTLTELSKNKLKNAFLMLKAARNMDKETKAAMNEIIRKLFEKDKKSDDNKVNDQTNEG